MCIRDRLKIDGTLWVGNVEIHTQASDWLSHGHDRDRAYDTVILHVVEAVSYTHLDVYKRQRLGRKPSLSWNTWK